MPPFEDAERPRAPHPSDAVTTATGRQAAAVLRGIHDHLRAELAQVDRALRAAQTDAQTEARRAADLRALVNDLSMGTDYRALGSFCGRYCSVVDVHHRIEDAATFVDLRAADPSLGPVLDRLSQEHAVVHGALVALDAALVAMLQQEAAGLPAVLDAFAVLRDDLLSHLEYEERELLPALTRLEVRV